MTRPQDSHAKGKESSKISRRCSHGINEIGPPLGCSRPLGNGSARGATNAARQRTRLQSDDGGGWTGLRLGRAWAVRLPRREIARVALARTSGLAGSTLLGSVDARPGTRHSDAPAVVQIHEAAGSAWGLGARGPHRHSGGMATAHLGRSSPGATEDPPGPRNRSLRSRLGRRWS